MNVLIYGKENCVWCERAKELCRDKDLSYTYRDVGEDQDALNELKARIPDVKTVPQIFVNGVYTGGYEHFAAFVKGVE